MIQDILIISIITALLTQAWTWAFPPLEWLKEKLNADPWADLPVKATMPDYLRYAAWKLAYCTTCIGWWSGLIAGLILFGWIGILCGFCSMVISRVIDQVVNK